MIQPWQRKQSQLTGDKIWKDGKRVPMVSLSEQERTRVLAARELNEKLQQRAEERRKINEEKKRKSAKF